MKRRIERTDYDRKPSIASKVAKPCAALAAIWRGFAAILPVSSDHGLTCGGGLPQRTCAQCGRDRFLGSEVAGGWRRAGCERDTELPLSLSAIFMNLAKEGLFGQDLWYLPGRGKHHHWRR